MSNLQLVDLSITNGFNELGLNLTIWGSIISGLLVISINNPIVSILYLICLFICIAVNLMYLGINFIGLSYLLVYVGAVSILFLFILMLINIRISEIVSTTSNSIPLAITVSILFITIIKPSLPLSNVNHNTIVNNKINPFSDIQIENIMNLNTNTIISYEYINKTTKLVTSNYWDLNLTDISHIKSLGNILYTSYPMLILLTSLVLLLSMVGAIIITIKTKI